MPKKAKKNLKKSSNKNEQSLILGLAVLIMILSGLLIWMLRMDDYGRKKKADNTGVITSFDECKAAGHPIAESYPEQCFADGKSFVNETQQ